MTVEFVIKVGEEEERLMLEKNKTYALLITYPPLNVVCGESITIEELLEKLEEERDG